ncbi:MAG: hypothetical protein ACYC3L_12960 [Gemmatimonadaceae bacterium]
MSSLLAGMACEPRESPPEPVGPPVPAKVAITLTPAAESFVVGTSGQVSARIVDQAGAEMAWYAPRLIEATDSSVLGVDADGTVLARRVGASWLRVTWAGPVAVRDSVLVRVGVRGVGTVRFMPVEGGCWAIQTDPRTAYEPTNLPVTFRTDGLRVRFAAGPSRYGSFCMVGTLVDLDSIRVDAP